MSKLQLRRKNLGKVFTVAAEDRSVVAWHRPKVDSLPRTIVHEGVKFTVDQAALDLALYVQRVDLLPGGGVEPTGRSAWKAFWAWCALQWKKLVAKLGVA